MLFYKCSVCLETFPVKPSKPLILDPVHVNHDISGTKNTPLSFTCLSSGGYPEQTVKWYRVQGTMNSSLQGCTNIPESKNGLFDVTTRCTFTPTDADDNTSFFCQSSFNGEPTLTDTSNVVRLLLKCEC